MAKCWDMQKKTKSYPASTVAQSDAG